MKKNSMWNLSNNCMNTFPVSTLQQPVPMPDMSDMWACKEAECSANKKGKPMRYNETNAVATINTIQSDASTQREYLLSRLAEADGWRRRDSLIEMFNLKVDNTPKTYKELIDSIKKGKFTLDEKRIKVLESQADYDEEDDFPCGGFSCGPFDGIIWDGPQPDRKGYDAAIAEKAKQYTAAKDIIMTGDAAAGLAALQAFEAWTPKTK